MTKKRKILLIAASPVICVLLVIVFFVCAALFRPEPEFDFDDPESLWQLAERTERYIIRSTDRGLSVREEAMKALEDIALLDVSYDEKTRLIRERFPEESFWTDDVKNVLKQAESGDAEAQFQLGCFYSWRRNVFASDADLARGGCVMKSYAMAFKWFRKAAMQGHAKAQSRLAGCILFGHPAYKNIDGFTQTKKIEEQIVHEMEDWYTRAGKQGEPIALYYGFGPNAYGDLNRKEALAIFRAAAEAADVEAMFSTADLLKHLFQDARGAAEWYRKAAELGDVRGMMACAASHETEMEREMADDDTGPGPVDWEWRRKAFDAAMRRLDEGSAEELRSALDSFCLNHLEEFTGGESEADFITRLLPRLLELIERHGDYEYSDRIIGYIQTSFGRKGIAGVDRETVTRLRAELGIYVRQHELALDLRSGSASDQAEAVRLLRKLAGFGYAEAQHTLALCYLNGRCGVPKDKAEAVKWLRKAAERRNHEAMGDLSQCLMTGDEPRSWTEGISWGLRYTAYPEYDSFTEYLIHAAGEKLETLWHQVLYIFHESVQGVE